MSFTSVDLPEPETPVTTVITPSGKCHIDALQIVLACAQNLIAFPFGDRRVKRICDLLFGRRCTARSANRGASMICCGVPLRDYFSAMTSSAWTKVDHIVGSADGLFIVLHYQHRISQITQRLPAR